MTSGETITISVRGARHRIERLTVNDRPGPWLVFLHEGLGSIPQWRSFPADLAHAVDMNAIVYERRNHGGSDPLPGPRTRDYHTEEADILEALLTTLGIDRVVSYGHSDGATIALLHAARHPNRVAAVVSVAGHIVTEEIARRGVAEARRRFDEGPLRDALRRYHGDHVEAMFGAWADTWLRPEFTDWTIVEELSPIVAPVLVVQGEDDEYATPAHVDWIADAVSGPAECWLVSATGHAPHLEDGDGVVRRVAEFLERHGIVGGTQPPT